MYDLIRDWLSIYLWSDFWIVVFASTCLFWSGAFLYLLCILPPLFSAVLFLSVYLILHALAAAVDEARKRAGV